MDMLNILKNFDSAEKGEKPAAGAENTNEMKTILESFQAVQESDTAMEECGMGMPPSPAPMPEQDKVKMNVSLNADGIDAIEDLIKLMGGKGEQHVDIDSHNTEVPMKLPMPMPKDSDDERGDMAKMIALAGDEHEKDEDVEEEWDNAPEEVYSDHDTMTKDLSGGINRQKKQYAKAEDGDNPMAVESIKDQLWAALNEKKKCKKKKY